MEGLKFSTLLVLTLLATTTSAQPIPGALFINWGQVAVESLLEWAKNPFFSAKVNGSSHKILVTSGSPFDNGQNTEIIDLEDSTFNCTKVGQFPAKYYGGIGGLVHQIPFVCGGSSGPYDYSKSCFALQENGEWAEDNGATLNTARVYSAIGNVQLFSKFMFNLYTR